MVGYLIAIAVWLYRLRRPTDWAWGSVANADIPLAYELATALACRAHLSVPNNRPVSRMKHSVGNNQEYQSLSGSAITFRLLALISFFSSPISLSQSRQLDNSSDVALLRSSGRKARPRCLSVTRCEIAVQSLTLSSRLRSEILTDKGSTSTVTPGPSRLCDEIDSLHLYRGITSCRDFSMRSSGDLWNALRFRKSHREGRAQSASSIPIPKRLGARPGAASVRSRVPDFFNRRSDWNVT